MYKELCFINSAYLSELWAVQDLLRFKKKFPDYWTPSKETQLQDEIRHANILLHDLKKHAEAENYKIVMDLTFSMQEKLYRKHLDLSQSSSPDQYEIIHNMTEKRALWIYKTFLKLNPNSKFKPIITQIIDDEKNHLVKNELNPVSHFFSQSVGAVDRMIFRSVLPQKYGNLVFNNIGFWDWYYS